MVRKSKDPEAVARDEIAEAVREGKTKLSIHAVSPEIVRLACEVSTLVDLRISDLKVLPPEIGNLVNLRELDIQSNQLTTLPKQIGKLANLTHLRCYSNKITELPDEIEGLISLEQWIMWSNQLQTLPSTIGRLTKLRKLELKRNRLARLPDEIGSLAQLEELDLEANQLTELPKDLSGLLRLRELSLGNNKLHKFPSGIADLPALERLELQKNQIADVPTAIERLARLREVFLQQNKLAAFPTAFINTPVQTIDLSNNEITEIPLAIGGMKELIGIDLTENPVSNVPADIVEQGKTAIFIHLGLTKERTVEDVVDPKVVAARKDAIDQFVRGTRRRMTDEKMCDAIVAFISGKSSKVPPARLKDHYSFGHIADVLLPHREWTFIDRRILAFITQQAWDFKQPGHSYDTGYHDEFFRWVKKQIEEEFDDSWFAELARDLVAAGLEPFSLVRRAIIELDDHLVTEDGSTTSFGRWLVRDVSSETLAAVARKEPKCARILVPLLVQHAPTLFEQLADVMISLEPDEDGEVHLPDKALTALCKSDPARWDALLQDALPRLGDCMACRVVAIHILGMYYPQRREQARELAIKLLGDISERKNKEDRFQLRWVQFGWGDSTPRFIGWMLDAFGDGVVPAVLHYAEETKVFDIDVAEVVAAKLGQRGVDIVAEGLNMKFDSDDIAPHFRRMFALLAPLDWSKYHDRAWQLAQSEYPRVREVACFALGRLSPDVVIEKATALLAAKKSVHRQSGAMLLSLVGGARTKAALDTILANEATDDVRDVVVKSRYRSIAAVDRKEADRRVESAAQRGKLNAPVAKWLDDKRLPPLAWSGAKGKSKVDSDIVRFLFHRQTRAGEVAPDMEVRDIYPLIERSDAFGDNLLQLIIKNGGANAKNRFALTVVGMLGGDSVVAALEKLAVDGKNLNAVATLALLRSTEAARALDRIARVFRTKYPNVREAALDGFSAIADAMDMTPFELADSMLSDCGFIDHVRPVQIGKRALEIAIGTDLKPVFREAGTLLKTTPKELTAKHKAELKELTGELREAARSLRSSLEYYMIVQRRWKVADWKAFFTVHPVALAFARGLVWATYEGGRRVLFRLTFDNKPNFVDAVGGLVPLSGAIGLVHPLDMTDAERAAWQAVLADQPLPQLARPTHSASSEELTKKLAYSFDGKSVNAGTFKSRAERFGWRRGSVVDGGAVSAYRKNYPTDHIEVFVRVDNLGIGFDAFDSEATVRDLFFVKSGSVVTGSYTYDEPRDDSDSRLIKLGDVPAIILSETIAELKAIVKAKADSDT